ncbi:hypothetical protein PGTUg99_004437 [Puccinia graminis f. sp. tritici]|uniref:PLD phosphodiesterase domain-containing protein n=1 Tax=Puccinia graminis f. sp. tritici TaxID=56615 RepID=A0A5B0PUJ6_PUCGR|nr:hypothetical protein PGTUg99_004437 [Puccinia graminis f. sp. tritici]
MGVPLPFRKPLKDHDFGSAAANLVVSIQGTHPANSPMGQAHLAEQLKTLGLQSGPGTGRTATLECQGSSIGSYDLKWLNNFYRCASGSPPTASTEDPDLQTKTPPLTVLYPTLHTVRNSHSGKAGAGTLFCNKATWEKANFPTHIFADTMSKRTGVLMHVKMILGLFNSDSSAKSTSSTLDTASVEKSGARDGRINKDHAGFLYIGSHNFTPAAWGKFNLKSGSDDSTSLEISNWELGVVLPVKSHAQAEEYVTWQRPTKPYGHRGKDTSIPCQAKNQPTRPSTTTTMNYQPIQAAHNHQHLVPPRSRKCNLLLLTLIPIIFCLSSLSFIAFKQSQSSQPTLISSPSLYSLKLFDHHQLKSQAKQLSSDLLSWLDSVHNPLRLPYSSTSDYDSDQDNPLLNPPNDQSPRPILPLLLNSRQSWKSILHSQPLSLQQARLDYEQNFHPLQPPPGFDQWFQFARLHNFTLINRFDSLMSDLEPFRKLAPTELSRRTQELVKIPGITLVKINPDSSVQTSSPSGRFAAGHALQQIIDCIHSQSDFKLPALELAINENSEARVLPRQTRPLAGEEFSYLSDEDRKLYDQQDPEKKPSLAGFKPQWGQDGNVWDAYRRACPSDSAARRLVETIRSAESLTGAVAAGGGLSSLSSTQTHLSMNRPTRLRALPIGTAPLPSRRELTFLSELESAASFCERPSTHRLHSAFFADQRSIEHLYPLFSPSKPQGFADILIPSYYHYSPRAEFVYESDYKSGRNPTPADIPWNQKANKMYWHGKLTRGADTPPGHTSSFQKQRLVKLVSNDTESAASLTSMAHKQGETDPSWRSETSRVLVSLNVTSENLLSVSAPATVVDPLMLDIAMACDPKAGECH